MRKSVICLFAAAFSISLLYNDLMHVELSATPGLNPDPGLKLEPTLNPDPTLMLKLADAFKADILSHKKTFRRFALETLGVDEYERLLTMIDKTGIEYMNAYDALYLLFRHTQ